MTGSAVGNRPVSPWLLAVLVAISTLQPFAINVLAPATPGLTRSLGTDYATVQLTLTLYLVTVAVTQLLVGPVSDRIGRRPCILAGIALFALGSAMGAAATEIGLLLTARIVQAIGGGTCFALARAVVRDSAGKDQAASLIGYIATAMVVAPMVAPLVGGFLDARFGWRSIFIAMLALSGAVAVAAVPLLKETAPRTGDASLRAIVSSYPALLRHRAFLGYALMLSFVTAAFFAFVAGAPYIVVSHMGHTPDVYGAYFVLNAGGYMIGNFLTGRLGQRLGSDRLIRVGFAVSIAAVTLEAAVAALLPWTPLTLFLPLTLNGIGNGLIIPSATAGALSVRPELAGTAAGLSGAAQLGFGALSAVVAGHLVTLWPQSLVVAMLAYTLLGWLCLILLVRRR
ncbi:MAG TPA: multidrug effflux MFS transporter [Microvirga sp.]|jgi:DHA1 family bicyclomycin/chloramphenicol resistance-like MFS transporter|nr:multidrug effflux MFS transporter [Microvirga sp.]